MTRAKAGRDNLSPLDLAHAKLAASGLPKAALKALGLEVLTAQQTQALGPGFKPLISLKLPYHGLDGKPRPDGFFRLRYLQEEVSFLTVTGTRKAGRYTQPADGGVAAYLPRTEAWAKVAEDPTVAIVITEGELKAASGCEHGYTTIGLGGVYNWRSARLGLPFLPELEAITWRGRTAYLCFDSDFKTNPMVTQALGRFAAELCNRGAQVFVVSLPEVYEDGSKTGLDDFLVARGGSAFEELMSTAEGWSLGKVLWEFNEEVVYVRDPGFVVVQGTRQKLSPQAFRDHAYANRQLTVQEFGKDGEAKLKKTSLPKAWLEWPNRYDVARLSYLPGKPRIHENVFNTWPGWGCQPVKGDVSPWVELLDYLFEGTDPGARTWFEQWCAYPIQYPGTKLYSACLIWGVAHGTGKSLVGYSLGRVYGDNYQMINQNDLLDDFNDWLQDKQLIMADDITGLHKLDKADLLKTMIVRDKVRIKIKYVPNFTVPDCINYLVTSNQPDALLIENRDRRYFVHEVKADPRGEEEYLDYMLWIDSEAGRSALHHYLLHEVDTSGFNPTAHAYLTQDKLMMIDASASDVGVWLARLKEYPDEVLRLGGVKLERDLYTNQELRELFDPEDKRRLTSNFMGRELRKLGFRQVNDGRGVTCEHRAPDRYYAVRNAGRWGRAAHDALRGHLDKTLADKTKRKY